MFYGSKNIHRKRWYTAMWGFVPLEMKGGGYVSCTFSLLLRFQKEQSEMTMGKY